MLFFLAFVAWTGSSKTASACGKAKQETKVEKKGIKIIALRSEAPFLSFRLGLARCFLFFFASFFFWGGVLGLVCFECFFCCFFLGGFCLGGGVGFGLH